tara:strand:- start:907 stop:1200 length:294 start_codon:yes stop_codon:yes gene_type:complete
MNIKPMGSRVVLRPKKKEETTSSGIILPDSAQDKPQTAEVLAVGDGGYTPNGTPYKMSVKVGDLVVLNKFPGNETSVNGEDVLIVPEQEILAVLEEK